LPARIRECRGLVLTHDQKFLTIELDVIAGILPNRSGRRSSHPTEPPYRPSRRLPLANGNNLRLPAVSFCGVGNEQTANLLFLLLDALNYDAIVKADECS